MATETSPLPSTPFKAPVPCSPQPPIARKGGTCATNVLIATPTVPGRTARSNSAQLFSAGKFKTPITARSGLLLEGSPQHLDDPQAAERIAKCFRENSVRLVCLDFDHTLISVHTDGWWDGTAEDLASFVRPEFLVLIPALFAHDIALCIVTFSPQVDVISGVLESCFGPDVASRIPIRGDDGSWSTTAKNYEDFGLDDFARGGKIAHIVSAAVEISTLQGEQILCHETVLLDDDPSNILCAEDCRLPAILYDKESVVNCETLLTLINRLRLSPEKLAKASSNVWKTPSPPNENNGTTSTPLVKLTKVRLASSETPLKEVPRDGLTRKKAVGAPMRENRVQKENKRPLLTPSPAFKTMRNPPKRFNKMKKGDEESRMPAIEHSMSELRILDGPVGASPSINQYKREPKTPRRVSFR